MMKKITSLKKIYVLLGSGLLLSGSPAFAKQVPESDAKKVAENFFSKYKGQGAGELSYTSLDNQGNPLFYVFNMNNKSGFVIVSAEDAGFPIIGYSTEQAFQKPDSRSATAFWLSKRGSEINFLRENNITPNAQIVSKWSEHLNPQHNAANRTSAAVVVAPLVLSKWNQSPFYNDSCPGGSVTGCVATTMAQIMRYWSYPAQGTGSSSYCDCPASGFPNNYGTLKANHNTTYNWNNMPLTISGHNGDIAKLMYHCGVSVHMNYDPAGSSAAVINSDSPISAEHAFVTYFKYDPSSILGVHRSMYSNTAWYALLKGDIDIGRPVEYAGFGPQGGHTWVCDGYDDSDMFHMNWGWGGAADGYFSIDNLNPMSDDFSSMQEGLFGIVPLGTNGDDAGVLSISPIANACLNTGYTPSIKIRNYSASNLNMVDVNYKIDNGPVQTMSWSGNLVTGQTEDVSVPALTLANGAHNITAYVSNPNTNPDVNVVNDQSAYSFALFSTGTLPVVEGFEVPSQTANHWSILPSAHGSDWSLTSQSYAGGAQSIMINNLTNTAGNVSMLQGLENYDLAALYHPYVFFKVAYQRKASTNNDKLSLQFSNDCGQTWWVKWSKQGAALASVSALSSSAFVPAPSDFVQYSVPGVNNHSTVMRWVFEADATAPGNNIYLDDINLGEQNMTVGINQLSSSASSFNVYPNPSTGAATLSFQLDNSSSVEISVSDISGRKVMEVAKADYSAGSQSVLINGDNVLSQGVYMVTISANGLKSSRKLVIN